MLPVMDGAMPVWKMVEVKSSTSVKTYQEDDAAIQLHSPGGWVWSCAVFSSHISTPRGLTLRRRLQGPAHRERSYRKRLCAARRSRHGLAARSRWPHRLCLQMSRQGRSASPLSLRVSGALSKESALSPNSLSPGCRAFHPERQRVSGLKRCTRHAGYTRGTAHPSAAPCA